MNSSIVPTALNTITLTDLLMQIATRRAFERFELSYGKSNAAMFAWRDAEYERLRAHLN